MGNRIQTKGDIRRAIRDGETSASLLEQPGHMPMTRGSRLKLAGQFRDLTEIARRAFDPHARNDFAAEPQDRAEPDDETADLFADDAA